MDDLTPKQRALKRAQDQVARLEREERHADKALSGKPDAEKPADDPPKDEPAERSEEAPADEPPPKAAEKPPTLADLGLKTNEEPVYATLTAEDLEEIRRVAREKVAKERRAKERKAALEEAMAAERLATGAADADEVFEAEMAEMTTVHISLPSLRSTSGRLVPPDPIIIDQRVYPNGKTFEVTRAEAEYLQYLMFAAWQQQAVTEGLSRTYYNEALGFNSYGLGDASGGRLSPGPRFGQRQEQTISQPRRLS